MTDTNNTDGAALLPVTPSDREAAARLVGEAGCCACLTVAAEAFARHRISHSLPGDVGTDLVRNEHRVRGSSAPSYCTPYGTALAAVETFREALRPFAEVADQYHDSDDDHHEVWLDAGPERIIRASFKLEHYRKARSALAALTPSAVSGDAGEGRFQKYLADETNARARLATFSDTVRQRLINWQEGQSEWFSDTLLEIVAEFIAFDDASRAGEAENKAGGLWYRRWHTAQTRVNELESLLANPPKHKFWGAGEADCPREIKASNGELHTLRCKVCGLDNPRDDLCRAQRENEG